MEESVCLFRTSAGTGRNAYTGDIGGSNSGSLGGFESTLIRFEWTGDGGGSTSSGGSAKGDGPLGVGSFCGYSSSASEPRTGSGGGMFK